MYGVCGIYHKLMAGALQCESTWVVCTWWLLVVALATGGKALQEL